MPARVADASRAIVWPVILTAGLDNLSEIFNFKFLFSGGIEEHTSPLCAESRMNAGAGRQRTRADTR
jgi:hypothetical protein